jgi:hypothetical protein
VRGHLPTGSSDQPRGWVRGLKEPGHRAKRFLWPARRFQRPATWLGSRSLRYRAAGQEIQATSHGAGFAVSQNQGTGPGDFCDRPGDSSDQPRSWVRGLIPATSHGAGFAVSQNQGSGPGDSSDQPWGWVRGLSEPLQRVRKFQRPAAGLGSRSLRTRAQGHEIQATSHGGGFAVSQNQGTGPGDSFDRPGDSSDQPWGWVGVLSEPGQRARRFQ